MDSRKKDAITAAIAEGVHQKARSWFILLVIMVLVSMFISTVAKVVHSAR